MGDLDYVICLGLTRLLGKYRLWEVMSARHAVLGLVIERPGYGYQLARRLEERCGSWRWEPSGVYSALDQLERDEHVLGDREKGSRSAGRGAPRVIYTATPKGRDFFAEWLLGASPPSPARQELDLKILLSGPEFLPRLIDQTWGQEQQCMDELRALTSAMPAGAVDPSSSWGEAAVILQRNAEIKLLQVRIEWLQDARKVMRRMIDRDGRPAG
jgi:DNA-binding PadR family transcriptional regulator